MAEIIAKYLNKNLSIFNLPELDQRKYNKLRFLLNANKDIKWNLNNCNLNVFFQIKDEFVIISSIYKIINNIEKLINVKILPDEQLGNAIKNLHFSKDDYTKRLNVLKTLKIEDNLISNPEFIEYKKFCDSTLKCSLRDYQYAASYYLTIGNGGFDFSVPGSGKTIISYAAYNWFKFNNICNYVLIIGPINSFNAWKDEYSTCFNKPIDIENLFETQAGYPKTYLNAINFNHSEITFINIDKVYKLQQDLINFLKNKDVLLIIDEAHKEKNPEAKITMAVQEITKYAKCRILLTGTPMPNGYEDLYSLAKIFSPYNQILPFKYNELKSMTKNKATNSQILSIMDSIKPWYSRVSKKYLIEKGEILPANFFYKTCEMSMEQREIYDFLDDMYFNIDNDFDSKINLNLAKAILIRQMQVSSNPALLTKSIIDTIDEYKDDYIRDFENDHTDIDELQKADQYIRQQLATSNIIKKIKKFETNQVANNKNLEAIELALNIVKQGKKVILWEIFVNNMYSLLNLFRGKGYDGQIEIINGLVTGFDRNTAINNFKNGNSMILIANPATLAESLSLHRCCQNAIYVNRNFNAAQFIQSKDRIHRINMPINTTATYYFLLNDNSIDDKVNERLTLKENNMLKILDSDSIEISGNDFQDNSFISKDDIKSIFNCRGQ